MSVFQEPLDSNRFVRYLHLHCFTYIFDQFRFGNKKQMFSKPRFELFRSIKQPFQAKNSHRLFKNLLFTYHTEIIKGIIITLIYASLGLLIPQVINQFMNFMKNYHIGSKDIQKAHNITQKYALLLLLRTIFQIHTRRLFDELSIKIESSLALKLIKKALLMNNEYRSNWHDSEVYHFQNIHLKLISDLFRHLYLVVEIPFTIIIAILMLFYENFTYGIIGLYWFTIAFLIQRSLDDKMVKCNIAKWKLIEKRSKFNYEFMEKVIFSRLTQEEALVIQKNNDFFIDENHDHALFYKYCSLYDMTQILLPIIVVISVALYDYNEETPFTIQQVFVMLSLLGICYKPMKNYSKLRINISDGLHSLKRISAFFDLPEEPKYMIKIRPKKSPLLISAHTLAQFLTKIEEDDGRSVSKRSTSQIYKLFQINLSINHSIKVAEGERLVILGRKGQGKSMFLKFLIGNLTILQGNLTIGTKVAYHPEIYFLLHGTIAENLIFYNNNSNQKDILKVYNELGLNSEVAFINGINSRVELNKFSYCQLKKILLARILCSDADIYIVQNPFEELDPESAIKVNSMFREKQKQGKIVIFTCNLLEHAEISDKVLIIDQLKTVEFDYFNILLKDPHSNFHKFIKNNEVKKIMDHDQQQFAIIKKFQQKVHKAMILMALSQKQSQIQNKKDKFNHLLKVICEYSAKLKNEAKVQKKIDHLNSYARFKIYLKRFLSLAPLRESIFILLIILAAETLHIFIHFFIGHEYQHYSKKGLSSLQTLMMYEFLLTLGLCAIIYLEGEVSSAIAIIKSNQIYKSSLQSFSVLNIEWYRLHYQMKMANVYNHDYEQIFIIFHNLLEIFKNCVVLLITIFFVGSNTKIILLITIIVAGLYYSIQILLRNSMEFTIKNYEFFKYEFVKSFQECIQGSSIFHAYGITSSVIKKAEEKYERWASYKLGTNYSRYGQNFLCDLTSIFIGIIVFEYGIGSKSSKMNEGFIAASILLLINLSDVLKAIVNLSIDVEVFFRTQLTPIMKINQIQEHSVQQHQRQYQQFNKQSIIRLNSQKNSQLKRQMSSSIEAMDLMSYHIIFNHVIFNFQLENLPTAALALEIKEGQKVIFLETNQTFREEILKSLTNNLYHLKYQSTNTVFIGGRTIASFTNAGMTLINAELFRLVGTICWTNFYLSGKLRDNLSWGLQDFDEKEALMFCYLLEIDNDFQDFAFDQLDCEIPPNIQLLITIKIALLKVLIRKPKIILIYDTQSLIEKWSMVNLLKEYIPGCTIIKISNNIEEAYQMDRIIYTENMNLREDGNPHKLYNDRLSWVGDQLRAGNRDAYIYLNQHSKKHKLQAKKTNLNQSQNKCQAV